TSDVSLDSSGKTVTLSGTNGFQLFTVQPGVSFTLKGLTLSGGRETNGGALYVGSGATVILSNCTLAGNSAVGSNGVAGAAGSDSSGGNGGNGGNGVAGVSGLGGAIFNLGSLSLLNCALMNNSASGGNG